VPPRTLATAGLANDGTEVDLAGDVLMTEVKDEENKLEEERGKDVYMTDSRPGDDFKIDTQRAEELSGNIDAQKPTTDDMHTENLGSRSDSDISDKKTDSMIPWPLLDADRPGSRHPVINDQDKTTTTTGEENTTSVPEPETIAVVPVVETFSDIPAIDTMTAVPDVNTTTSVSEAVVSDSPPSAVIVDVPLIHDHDKTPTTELTTTDRVIEDGDVVSSQGHGAPVAVSPGKDDEDEGESLMEQKQRLGKEAEVKLEPDELNIEEDLLDLSGEPTQLAPTVTHLDTDGEEMTQGVNYVQFSLFRDVPMSDDDDLFLDCDSTASVSNFDGI